LKTALKYAHAGHGALTLADRPLTLDGNRKRHLHRERTMAKLLTIEARVARYLVDDLRGRHVPIDGLLKEVRLRRADLANPEARVPYVSVIGLIERAATLVGDDSFGLRIGASGTRDRGLLGFVALNSPTLMDAMANLRRHSKIVRQSEEFEIERSSDG
jgi:hypothetical protein